MTDGWQQPASQRPETADRIDEGQQAKRYNAVPASEWECRFPFVEIEFDGLMVACGEILPFHDEMDMEVDNVRYMAWDTHALGSHADRTDPIVSFVRLNPQPDGGPAETCEEFAIWLSPARRQWRWERTSVLGTRRFAEERMTHNPRNARLSGKR